MPKFEMKSVRRRAGGAGGPAVERPSLPRTLGLVLLGIVCIAVGIERSLAYLVIVFDQGWSAATSFQVLSRVPMVAFAALAGGLTAFFRGASELWAWQKSRGP
jgi:hypothetical protein